MRPYHVAKTIVHLDSDPKSTPGVAQQMSVLSLSKFALLQQSSGVVDEGNAEASGSLEHGRHVADFLGNKPCRKQARMAQNCRAEGVVPSPSVVGDQRSSLMSVESRGIP